MCEVWRDCGKKYYQVSTSGNIRSLDRFVKNRQGNYLKKGKVLKQIVGKNGYLYTTISNESIIETYTIHRLVAMTFPDLVEWTDDAKGKPFEELDVNHKNEDKTDNRVENLQWCTRKENNNWGTHNKRMSESKKGISLSQENKDNISKALKGVFINRKDQSKPVIQYTKDGQFIAEYPSQKEASRQTGIDNGHISDCCIGKYKTAGGYKWMYSQNNLTIKSKSYEK